jgi:hypothetical protein
MVGSASRRIQLILNLSADALAQLATGKRTLRMRAANGGAVDSIGGDCALQSGSAYNTHDQVALAGDVKSRFPLNSIRRPQTILNCVCSGEVKGEPVRAYLSFTNFNDDTVCFHQDESIRVELGSSVV